MDIRLVYQSLNRYIPSKQLFLNEPMKNHTSFRIGGPADILVIPSEIGHIRHAIEVCNSLSVPLFIMGNGSNLLVRDKGIRGVVVKIAEGLNKVWISGLEVKAQAGVLLSTLSKMVVRNNLSGFEFASGIPGTLGGAVAMNAGAYGGEMKDVVKSVLALDRQGKERLLKHDDLKFEYRSSYIQQENLIVAEVVMELKPGEYEESMAIISDLTRRRRQKQPLNFPSAGSIFKRPKGYYAGKLIQDAGLKGLRVGDAQISELHANFIINVGNATAKDVIELIEVVKNEIMNRFGVEMHPEVKIVGEE